MLIRVLLQQIMKKESGATMYITKDRSYKVWIHDVYIVSQDAESLILNIQDNDEFVTLFKGLIRGDALRPLLGEIYTNEKN